MMGGKRFRALVMGFALLAAACGDDDADDATGAAETTETTETTVDEEEGPRTVTVQVDAEPGGDAHTATLGYFPREATVRQGDTVEFSFAPGDPHSVTFGTLVDEAFAEMASDGESSTADKIPFAVSPPPEPAAIPAGVLPCYTAEDPPTDGTACEEQDQPEFTGSLAFYSSGLLEPDDTFTVDLADDAEPGTYDFFCTLHGPDMSGSLTVVEADEQGQTADEVDEARQAELEEVADATQDVVEALSEGVQPGLEESLPQGANQLIAGGLVQEPVPAEILEFWPQESTVSAGESLTWNMLGFHTVSFNAPEGATPSIIPGEDGLPVLNPLSFAPQGGAAGAPPPPEGPPPEGDGPPPEGEGPPPPPMVIEGGEWDGSGFFSSGVLPSFPPMLLAYEITFTTPGTYPYVCLIHPDMEGTVTVTS